jgi:MFS family permease
VVVGVLAIQVASNTVQGPWQALIPDQVPAEQRGAASGLKAGFEILAFVAGRQVSGQLVAAGSAVGAVAVTSTVFGLAALFTLLAARESREAAAPAQQRGVLQALRRTFIVDWKAHPAFIWWFLNRFLFWSGFIALSTFLLFYMVDVVRMQASEAQRFVGNLSTVIGLTLLLVALPSGWLSDRVGRRPLVAAAGVLAASGTATILFFRSPNLLVASGAIIGLSVGIFLSANWALVTDIVPEGEAARYLGIANIATAGGSGLARFLGGAIIDPINSLTGSREFGYLTLYALTMIAFLVGTGAILRLPRRV